VVVTIQAGEHTLEGDLQVPPDAVGLVIFAHGSGSSRFSSRNRAVAQTLVETRFATLLLDLLTPREEAEDRVSGSYRFDIEMLGGRVVAAVDWAAKSADVMRLPIALFGASTGAAVALLAAAGRPALVRAIISRGGRPDLADAALPRVQAPTLLIVGSHDTEVIELNRRAMAKMLAPSELLIVPGASHLFEEPGTLEQVASLAGEFCLRHVT
jgi:putative phosphoribosyl transferase